MESISAILDSKSLIWKLILIGNEKSSPMRVKSHPKSLISLKSFTKKRRPSQSTTVFTEKQMKSRPKPATTSTSYNKTPQKQKNRNGKAFAASEGSFQTLEFFAQRKTSA
ncbi:hypothetical protein [Planococcus halotolerans]|uniref:Uncharacterized protein n=1 Tax=Planococcus halotolerans TaxID=2233542 RepID=A0A365L887_9BACL|nr:hypothetical protein [Planococcus halotolerans]QHJ69829.1 hypothetical protein DNR44_004085 [Planococcus halotolerans]RAZ81477.1 hypothetical protein DP120_04170 [Planococcus halotolerans]